MAGAKHGYVGSTLAEGLTNAGQWIDEHVPLFAVIERQAGLDPTAAGAVVDTKRAAHNAALDQQYGRDGVAFGGRLAGQIAGTAPLVRGGNLLLGTIGHMAGPAGEALLTGQSAGLATIPSRVIAGAVGAASPPPGQART